MKLIPRLRAIADRWVALHGRTDDSLSLKTLSVRAVGHSKLFERDTMTVETYEKVVAYLAEAGNWPLAEIPEDVGAILASLEVPAELASVA